MQQRLDSSASSRWRGAAMGKLASDLGLLVTFWSVLGLVLAGVGGCAVIARQVRRSPGHPLRLAWLLTVCVILLVSGSTLGAALSQLWSWPLAEATLLGHLATAPVLGLALAARIQRAGGRALWLAAALDALTATLVTAALALLTLPSIAGSGHSPTLLVVGLPPVIGAGLLVIVLHDLFLAPLERRRATMLLVLATALAGVRNTLIALRVFGFAAVPSPLLALAGTGLVLLLLAATDAEQTITGDGEGDSLPGAPPTLILFLPYGLLALLLLALAQDLPAGVVDAPIADLIDHLIGTAFLVVLARQWLLLRLIGGLLGQLRAAYVALKAAHGELAVARELAAREARTDPTTGLPNRRQLNEYLTPLLAQHRRTNQALAVVFADIDFFKSVNDRFGHDAGDAALRQVGQRLRGAVREGDIVARFGGEEFVLLLPSTTAEEAAGVAERVRQVVRGLPISLPDGRTTPLTISLGVAAFPLHGPTPEAVLSRADQALYAAKRGGRDCVRLAGVTDATGVAAVPA